MKTYVPKWRFYYKCVPTSSLKIYFCIDIDKFQLALNVLSHFLLFSDYSHIQSDSYAVSSCSHWLTASWASLLCSQPCVERNWKVRVWHKENVRGWIHRSTLSFSFFFLWKLPLFFQEQQSGTVSFIRVQVKTISLIMVKNETREKQPLSINLFLCYCSFHKSLLSQVLFLATWGGEGLHIPHQDDRKCFKCLAWFLFVGWLVWRFFENN